jgi:hypothetical protein
MLTIISGILDSELLTSNSCPDMLVLFLILLSLSFMEALVVVAVQASCSYNMFIFFGTFIIVYFIDTVK